jgi:hypothetical protein
MAIAVIAAACSPSEPEATAETTLPPTNSTVVETTIPASSPTTTAPETSSSTTTAIAATTTTTLPQTSTTIATTTTTTASTPSTTTPPPPTSTTLAPPPDNQPPSVTITSPGNLSSHVAAFDRESLAFKAVVSMSASASDPNGDPVTVDWYSSLSGYLGTGEYITASLITLYDSSHPYIMARATDVYGAVSEHTIQVIVWVPSDT